MEESEIIYIFYFLISYVSLDCSHTRSLFLSLFCLFFVVDFIFIGLDNIPNEKLPEIFGSATCLMMG